MGAAEGLAYDPKLEELYWTCFTHSTVNRIKVYNSSLTTVRPFNTASTKEVLVQLSSDDRPRAIQLDSCNKFVFIR